jgi:hypothetical protein
VVAPCRGDEKSAEEIEKKGVASVPWGKTVRKSMKRKGIVAEVERGDEGSSENFRLRWRGRRSRRDSHGAL